MATDAAVTLRWDQEEGGLCTLPLVPTGRLEWRAVDGGGIELRRPGRGDLRTAKAHWRPLLEGLSAGERLPGLVRRAAAAIPHKPVPVVHMLVTHALQELIDWGLVEVATPRPPAVFGGRYELVRELGRGGAGIVYLARDTKHADGPLVAVKHAWNLRGRFASRDRALRREAELMRLMDHPGIPHVLDAFEEDGRFHLVRPFLSGRRLPDVAVERSMTPAQRADIARQVVDIWLHIRARGYMHLDLKPGNFFLDDQGRVVLSDLGGCARVEPGTETLRSRAGTFSYLAPEVLKFGQASERGVVYSLGATYWQLVTGRMPRPKTPLDELVGRAEAARAEPWESAFVRRCCATDPGARPATMQDAAALLQDGTA